MTATHSRSNATHKTMHILILEIDEAASFRADFFTRQRDDEKGDRPFQACRDIDAEIILLAEASILLMARAFSFAHAQKLGRWAIYLPRSTRPPREPAIAAARHAPRTAAPRHSCHAIEHHALHAAMQDDIYLPHASANITQVSAYRLLDVRDFTSSLAA